MDIAAGFWRARRSAIDAWQRSSFGFDARAVAAEPLVGNRRVQAHCLAPMLAIFSPVLRQIRPGTWKRTRKWLTQRAAVECWSFRRTMATSALHWPSDPSP